MDKTENTSKDAIRIVRGKIDSLSLYEITDNELDILEVGSSNHIKLNFSIFLLTVGISFFIGLLTVPISSIRTFSVYVIFTTIGFLGGIILLLLWLKERKSISELVIKIKKRIPSTEVSKEETESTA